MEQTRVVLAIVLTVIVMLVWQFFFVTKETNDSLKSDGPTQTGIQLSPKKIETLGGETLKEGLEEIKQPQKDVDTISVNTPLYTASITENGAVFNSFKLKNYHETIQKNSSEKEMIDGNSTVGMFATALEGAGIVDIKEAIYECQTENRSVSLETGSLEVPFIWNSGNGVTIEKLYRFSSDSYLVEVEVTLKNNSNESLKDSLSISMENVLSEEKAKIGFEGPSTLIGNHIEEVQKKSLSTGKKYSGIVTWVAFQERYFMASIIPETTDSASVEFNLKDATHLISKLVLAETTILPNTEKKFVFRTYLGPKSIPILKTIGNRLEKVVDFGWFDFLARPCLWIMNLLHRYIPNYGINIIILTIFIRILLWPIGNKSYKSMQQMKRIQPLMADIREKYKEDKQKMNLEMMALYKTYKVNPLGGCLPILAQLPVFIAFYRMLYQAVELRHAPFVGWINDLSAPDRLFNFNFHIPFMEAPYGIPVLTIIMGVTQLIQQKMQPPMGDPAQAKMMMFMPIVFMVIFINFSSGLVLYWAVSNTLSILQQYYVNKKNR